MMPFNFAEMLRQRDCRCLPRTLDRFEDALDRISEIPRIRNCLYTNHIVKEAAKMYKAQHSHYPWSAKFFFIIHHPTLLAPFPSHIVPPEKRWDILKDICYDSVTDAVLKEYHQLARSELTPTNSRRRNGEQTPQMMMQPSTTTTAFTSTRQPARLRNGRKTPQMMMQSSTTTTIPRRRSATTNAKNTPSCKPKTIQRDLTNTEDSLLSDWISGNLLRLAKSFLWGGRSATPLEDDSPYRMQFCLPPDSKHIAIVLWPMDHLHMQWSKGKPTSVNCGMMHWKNSCNI
jgi:hypothetical protein